MRPAFHNESLRFYGALLGNYGIVCSLDRAASSEAARRARIEGPLAVVVGQIGTRSESTSGTTLPKGRIKCTKNVADAGKIESAEKTEETDSRQRFRNRFTFPRTHRRFACVIFS